MADTTIQENTMLPVRWAPTDADGAAIAPSTVRWRIDCVTTGTEVIEWQEASPAATVNVTIPASANAIINDANPYEVKRITFQADAGLDSSITAKADYTVENNRFVS